VTRARGNPPISESTDGFDNSGIERCFPRPLDPPVKPADDEGGELAVAGDEKKRHWRVARGEGDGGDDGGGAGG